MKKGFGIIQALVFLILVSFLMMIALKTASVGVKHVSDTYVKEQAELFMHTSIENAILAIEGYERNSSSKCLTDINFSTPPTGDPAQSRFISHTKVLRYYCYKDTIGDDKRCPCDNAVPIETEDSHGTVLMSTIVETNSNHPKNYGKKIRLVKVTIQRP
jgi:hypothetical protein